MKNTAVFRILFWLGLALNASAAAQASPAKCQALFEPMKNVGAKTEHLSVSTLPSPSILKLLTRIEGSGLALSRLSLKLRSGNRAEAEFFYDGELIGAGQLQDRQRGVRPHAIYVHEIHVQYPYSARGLGTLLYLILAREAQKQGLLLESSWDPTPADKATWNGMVQKGWARKIDSLFSEMNRTFIDDAATIVSLDTIIQSLSKRSEN